MDKEDLKKLKSEGLNIVVPGGNTLSLGYYNGGHVSDQSPPNHSAQPEKIPQEHIREKILTGLKQRPMASRDFIDTGIKAHRVYAAMKSLKKEGKIARAQTGMEFVLKNGAHSNGK